MSLRHWRRAVRGETPTLPGVRHEVPSPSRHPPHSGLLDGGHSLPGPPSRRPDASRTAATARRQRPPAFKLRACRVETGSNLSLLLMCGIVGYVGKRPCEELLLQGLEKLEYRGYDSAGISMLENGEVESVHAVGNLAPLP